MRRGEAVLEAVVAWVWGTLGQLHGILHRQWECHSGVQGNSLLRDANLRTNFFEALVEIKGNIKV